MFSDGIAQAEARQEAGVLSGFDHSNVIKCFGVSKTEDHYDIVMEKGVSLRQARDERVFTEVEVLSYFRDICAGLAHVHSKDVVHLDLKSDNIILVDGQAKIADFGASRPLRRLHDSMDLCGTVPFMSPEIICGRPRDASTDIWSLGVTLYEMMTGAPPFQGEFHAIAFSIGCLKVFPALPLHFGASQKIQSLIAQCTQVDPLARPTAQELLMQL